MTDEMFQKAITSLAKGDKSSLRLIYEAYIRLIYTVVYDVVKRREDAEDITSEFFIKLVRVAGTYKKGMSHKAWLVQIARNMAIDYVRKSSRELLEYDDTGEDALAASVIEKSTASSETAVEDKAVLGEDMKRAMKALKPEEREVVDLKLIGEFKFREIAAQLGKPVGTITWLYNEAVKKLRRCLADYEQK